MEFFNEGPAWHARLAPPAAAKSFVQNLPDYDVTEQDIAEGRQCAVCTDNLKIRDACKRMPCKGAHVFHDECLLEWLRTRNSCPICRHELPTLNVDYEAYKRAQQEKEREDQDLDGRGGPSKRDQIQDDGDFAPSYIM